MAEIKLHRKIKSAFDMGSDKPYVPPVLEFDAAYYEISEGFIRFSNEMDETKFVIAESEVAAFSLGDAPPENF